MNGHPRWKALLVHPGGLSSAAGLGQWSPPVGVVACQGTESLIDASCFSGAIMAPKCQELICAFVMWTDGAGKGRGWDPLGEADWVPSRCGVGWGWRAVGWWRQGSEGEARCRRAYISKHRGMISKLPFHSKAHGWLSLTVFLTQEDKWCSSNSRFL